MWMASRPPGLIAGSPATQDDIASCVGQLALGGHPPPPPDYLAFLREADGLAWNGAIFCGTAPLFDPIAGVSLPDLIQAQEFVPAPLREARGLRFGGVDGRLFFFTPAGDRCLIVDDMDGAVLDEVDFGDLRERLFGDA